jgi:hypothetical protein
VEEEDEGGVYGGQCESASLQTLDNRDEFIEEGFTKRRRESCH